MQRRTLQKRFGRLVRQRRKALHLSQSDLAEQAGAHRTYISLVERGERNPSLHTLWKLADGLGVQPLALIAELEPPPRP